MAMGKKKCLKNDREFIAFRPERYFIWLPDSIVLNKIINDSMFRFFSGTENHIELTGTNPGVTGEKGKKTNYGKKYPTAKRERQKNGGRKRTHCTTTYLLSYSTSSTCVRDIQIIGGSEGHNS